MYDIHHLFQTQWWLNGGKCGVCGDPYDSSRENEPPHGKYAQGVITQTYASGSAMTATVHVTASHKGYFEFRLCPHNDPKVTVTQACLDQNLLEDPVTKGTKFYVDDRSVGIYSIELQLPVGVVCNACVLQWRYRTGEIFYIIFPRISVANTVNNYNTYLYIII